LGNAQSCEIVPVLGQGVVWRPRRPQMSPMPPTITEAHPPLPLDELKSIIDGFGALSLSGKKATIDRLVGIHPTTNVDWAGTWRYRRARRLDPGDQPMTVDQLIWRKGVPASLGRANPAGYDVLYLADRQDTALQEARVGNDLAVVADFQIRPGRSVRIAPIGELLQIHRTGRGAFAGDHSGALTDMLNGCAVDDARSLLITDAFLLNCLVGHDDYELSSQVALSVFEKLPVVTAVAYPSVRQLGATNFVVRTEGFWDNWGVRAVRYGQAHPLGMGFYRFSDTQGVDGIHIDGSLDWTPVAIPEETLLLDLLWTPTT
jgi:RES domain